MKGIRIALIACAVMVLAASAASADSATPRVDRRQWRQHARIHQGWQSGQLTRAERIRLGLGQRAIRGMEWRAKRDGHVDRWERRRLTRAQNHESRAIRRLEHNHRCRVF